jgi:hypothetical protein
MGSRIKVTQRMAVHAYAAGYDLTKGAGMYGVRGTGWKRLFAIGAGLAVAAGLSLPATAAGASSTVAGTVAVDATPDAAPPGSYDIIATLNCQCYNGQKTIAYRRGYYIPPDDGFGHVKVLQKHNMYTPVVAFIVGGPNHEHTSGKAGRAYAYAAHIVNGRLLEVVQLWAGYDTRPVSPPNRSFGIVTAYCQGYQGKCPQWVNQAINAQALPLTARSSGQPGRTELSYHPPNT